MKPPPSRAVPILTYHSFDASGSVVSFPPALFRKQLQALRSRGFTGVSLTRLLDGWEARAPLPERPLVLTFDDGFASLLDQAAPLLSDLGFTATVFVVAGACGKTSDWPAVAGVPSLPLLSWRDLAILRSAGFEIGCHSLTHAWLPGLPASKLRQEIVDSRRLLEDRLGAEVQTFAYPYGGYDPAAWTVVRESYRAAVTVEMGDARPRDDRHLLPRIDTYYLRHPAVAPRFGSLACGAYLRVRRTGRAVRARLERAGLLLGARPADGMGERSNGS